MRVEQMSREHAYKLATTGKLPTAQQAAFDTLLKTDKIMISELKSTAAYEELVLKRLARKVASPALYYELF